MAPKNPKSATLEKSVKNYPPLAKSRAKRLEVFQQIMKAKADLNSEKIDWKSEVEVFKKLSYSIQKESEGEIEKRLEELAGQIEKRLEELAASTEQCLEAYQQIMKAKANLKRRMVQPEIDWKSEAEAFGKLSRHIYSIQRQSEGKIEKRLEELPEVRNITSIFNSFSIDSSQKKA